MENKYCKNCGCLLEEGMRFCPNCQAPVDGNAQVPVPYYPELQPAPKKEKSSKVYMGIILSLCLVFLIAIGIGGVWVYNYIKNDDTDKDSEKANKRNKVTQVVSKDSEDDEKKKTDDSDDGFLAVKNTENNGLQNVPKNAKFIGKDYSGKIISDNADSEGMKIPECTGGQTLYIGYSEIKDIDLVKFALVLSADKSKIEEYTCFLNGLGSRYQSQRFQVKNVSVNSKGGLKIPTTEEQLINDCKILETALYGDVIYMKIHYIYKVIPDNTLVDCGEIEVWLKKAGT